jgi:hypothetical protein
MSMIRPSRSRSQRATRSSAAAVVARAKELTVLGVQRRYGSPWHAPIVPFSFQQPFAQARPENAFLQSILAIIRGVVDQHAADRGGIVDHGDRAEDGRTNKDRPLEMRLGPGFDGVPAQGSHRCKSAERRIVGPGRGRTRRFNEAICHDPYTYRWCCRMESREA